MVLARERATLIADSVAEAIRRDADRGPVVSQWRTRAASMLPQGDVAVLDQADGVRVAVVSWRRGRQSRCLRRAAGEGEFGLRRVAFAR